LPDIRLRRPEFHDARTAYPIQFGAIIVTNVAIGMAAPPIGYCLFVAMAVAKTSLGELSGQSGRRWRSCS